ncbi:MAG TPA: ATP-binding protein [Marmoricola sp.]|nr:ATP-binding protein [Marmoricola sp.]
MRRLSLSSQLLVLQMVIVVLVVTMVAGVSTVQTDASFRRETERRMLSAAEVLAANAVVRQELNEHNQPESTDVEAEIRRSFADASFVVVVDRTGEVLSSTVPAGDDDVLDVGEGTDLSGRTWTGGGDRYGRRVVEAHVPVISDNREDGTLGDLIGYVVVGAYYPSWWQVLATTTPQVFLYLVLAAAIGALGSVLLSRRVKRQTLGLEPREISALVEQREAMLHGVREGVVGVDLQGRVTFANDEALRLLDWAGDVVGTRVADASPSPELAAILGGEREQTDVAAVAGRRVLVLNTLPIGIRGRRTGSVVTMRDRTELLDVRRQLAATQDHTDTLRAQVHEFRNRLHAIAGMVELDEREELLEFIGAITHAMEERVDRIARHIADPAVAALLVAKAVRADELAVALEITEDSHLDPHSARFSADLVTVVGNLVDNAFDELGAAGGSVVVAIRDADDRVVVEVTDSGAGIDPGVQDQLFEVGRTSKGEADGEHGWGLALTRMACRRHGGDIRIDPGPPTRFIAELHQEQLHEEASGA